MTAMDVDQYDSNESQVPAGISCPPPHIRASIERSAAYLAFKEPELEFLFRETDTQGIYSFLNPIDPYYPYYRFRLQEIKEGETIYQERPQINNYREPVKIAPKEPGPDEISEHTSATLAYDLDVVKLVAFFTARMGRVFIDGWLEDEHRDPLFGFILPHHNFFPLFTTLVNHYTKVPSIPLPTDLLKKLKANGDKRYYSIIERAKECAEWIASQEPERQEYEKERVDNANIGWNGIVVAEAVAFAVDDERIVLTPPPMSLSEFQNMSLAQKQLTAMPEEDVVMDEEESSQMTPPQSPEDSDQSDYEPEPLANVSTSASARICPSCRAGSAVDNMVEEMRFESLESKQEDQETLTVVRKRKSDLVQEDWDVSKHLKTMHLEQ